MTEALSRVAWGGCWAEGFRVQGVMGYGLGVMGFRELRVTGYGLRFTGFWGREWV